jgi:carbon-monoxide dehydrogenase large subunit
MTPATTSASLDKAAGDHSDHAGFAGAGGDSAARGKLRGFGIAHYIEACGIAPSACGARSGRGRRLWESAEVRVNATVGTIEV